MANLTCIMGMVLLAACGRAVEPLAPLVTQALTGIVSFDFNGYLGTVCVETVGCGAQAAFATVSLQAGSYRIFDNHARDVDGSDTLGSISMNEAGQALVSAQHNALDTSDPTKVVLRTVSVRIIHGAYQGPLWVLNGGTTTPTAQTLRLIANRSYRMMDLYSRAVNDPEDSPFTRASTFNVSADDNGAATVTVAPEAASWFSASGNSLNVISVPVTIDHNGYPGPLWVYGAAMTTPSAQTIALIRTVATG